MCGSRFGSHRHSSGPVVAEAPKPTPTEVPLSSDQVAAEERELVDEIKQEENEGGPPPEEGQV